MAVLDKEKFNEAIRAVVGDSPDDAGLEFLTNMNDTYENRCKSTQDVRDEMKQLDDSWRKRYADAFNKPIEKPKDTEEDRAESITISDLFTVKERR